MVTVSRCRRWCVPMQAVMCPAAGGGVQRLAVVAVFYGVHWVIVVHPRVSTGSGLTAIGRRIATVRHLDHSDGVHETYHCHNKLMTCTSGPGVFIATCLVHDASHTWSAGDFVVKVVAKVCSTWTWTPCFTCVGRTVTLMDAVSSECEVYVFRSPVTATATPVAAH